jgi:Fibronectin type III domain/Cellulase (glycosyl hydrolase family 5)
MTNDHRGRSAKKIVVRIAAVGLAALACISVVPRALVHVNASTDPAVVSVEGNQFFIDGAPFVPHGFNSIALLDSEWCTTPVTQAAAAGFTGTELDLAKNTWNANTLRFQVSQPVLASVNGVAYALEIEQDVAPALEAGFVVIISMQDQSRACGQASPLPGPDTKTAWTTLITNTDLETDPAIMFEVFNEPQSSELTTATTNPRQFTWVDWLNGGRPIAPSSGNGWTAYTPIGHQDLVNYLRTGLQVPNVLIADGGRHAAHLEGIPLLADPGGSEQIAYAVHPYFYTDGQSSWDLRWGSLAGSNAVIATEWNYVANECGTAAQSMAPQLLSYMRNTINVGILGHSLDSYNIDLTTGPSLTPTRCGTAVQGAGADFFNLYMATFSTPIDVPTPTGLDGTAASGTEIDLTWEVPTLAESTLAGYHVYRNGTLVGTPTGNSFSDMSLQNGTAYSYDVDAFDTMWRTSPRSTDVVIATPARPAAPTIGTATAGDASATAAWTAPASDGGAPIVRYDVRVVDNATGLQVGALRPAAESATSLPVTGLTNGTTYLFQVAAVNSVGSSLLSASSNSVTPTSPATVPGAPVIGTATRGSAGGARTAVATWSAPSATGGSAITGYRVMTLKMSSTSSSATVLSTTTSGVLGPTVRQLSVTLASGNYRFQVVAINAVGTGARSARSNNVKPR